jgi:hypothetical protein
MSAKGKPAPKAKPKLASVPAKKSGPKPEPEPIGYTVARFSQLAGFDRHALATRIQEMNLQPVGKSIGQAADLYSIRDLVRAILGGDIEAEKLRKTREEADKLAIQNARSRGELIEIDKVKRLGQEVVKTVTTCILNMPMTDEEKDACLRNLLALGEMDWSRCA